jgi:hypothetical protein
MGCRLQNAYRVLKSKGMDDTEIFDTLKEADSFKAELKSGAESGGLPSQILKMSLESNDPTIRTTVITGTVKADRMSSLTDTLFVAKLVRQAGFDQESQEGTNYVMDKLKNNDRGLYEKTIKDYVTMGWGGTGAKAMFNYIENDNEAKSIAISTMKGMKADDLVDMGDFLSGNEVPGVVASTTLSQLYKTVKSERGFDAEKLRSDAEKEGISPLYYRQQVKTPESVALFSASGHPDALNTLENYYENFDGINNTDFIKTVNEMAKYGVSSAFGAAVPKANVLTGEQIKTYFDYNENYRVPAKEEITIDSVYGSMKWTDALGDSHKFAYVDASGNVWDPALNNGKGGYNTEFNMVQKAKSGYDSATWTLNLERYANDILLSKVLDGKTPDEEAAVLKDLGILDIKNSEWWSCVGTLCQATTAESSGGGGGSGPSSGKSYTPTVTEPTDQILYIECNVDEADVYNKATGQDLGNVNEEITMKPGTYTIQVKADGYTPRETPIKISTYPVMKTMNLTKLPPSISTFINGIGGIQNLNRKKYLYIYCIFKSRITSNYAWKTMAESYTSVPQLAIPTEITTNMILYLYYLVKGDTASAQKLVADGDVVLLETNPSTEAMSTGNVGGGL